MALSGEEEDEDEEEEVEEEEDLWRRGGTGLGDRSVGWLLSAKSTPNDKQKFSKAGKEFLLYLVKTTCRRLGIFVQGART